MSGEQLERRRAAARGRTTRVSKALQDLLADLYVTRVQLKDAVEEFDKRLATLGTVQAELELEISDPDLLIRAWRGVDVGVFRYYAVEESVEGQRERERERERGPLILTKG
ncbi:hypothetical protein E2C01_046155 [Portunus trituberculatus]|uniref:Uncharacterized protein n=1 Tax=Portunus trituberculatus TaxID=210409 RepID=A0A5B7FXP4_PORTR|nr:hypothetical protein [Portunus trituberculatus]